VTRRRRCRTNSRVEVSATPNDNSIVGEPQPQTAEGNFETGGRFFVPGEQIRRPQCVRVEGAA
jgi:hypothetical protein